MSSTKLAPCPDCGVNISPFAESCPHCGKPFERNPTEVIPGPRWSWTIYWGIVLFVMIPVLISAVVTVLLFIIFAASLAGVHQLGPR